VGLLNKWLGFRWSLYIAQNGNQLAYAMHENSVMRIVGYVMGCFADGAQPVPPWSLYLNFNHTHRTIQLRPEHFTLNGDNVTNRLIADIEAIDPGWKVKGAEPVFEERATCLLVAPYMTIDGLVADRELAATREATGDLLGAPAFDEELVDAPKLRVAEATIASGSRSATVGEFLSLLCAVTTIPRGAVAGNFPSDGAAVTAEHPGDVGRTETLHSKRSKHVSLLRGDLAIRHGDGPLLGGGETPSVSSDRLALHGGHVAVTL